MDSFLEQLTDSKYNANEIERYNFKFFSGLLNSTRVKQLITIKRNYLYVIEALKARYNPKTLQEVRDNAIRVSDSEREVSMLFQSLREFETRREEISKELMGLYSSENYNAKRINELEDEMANISYRKSELHFKLKKAIDKKNSLAGQKKKHDSEISKLDSKLKTAFDELVGSMSGVDLSNLDLFGCFENPEVLSQYREGLKKIIPNDLLRKSYVDYFTRFVGREAEHLISTVKSAEAYVKRAQQEDKMYFEEYDENNDRVVRYDNALSHVSGNVNSSFSAFNGFGLDPSVTLFANSYTEVLPFVEASLDYINGNGPIESEKKSFKTLTQDYNKIYSLNEKSKPFLAKLFKKGTKSVKSFGYDMAIQIFDFYTRDLKPVKEVKKEKTPKRFNSKFKPIEKEKAELKSNEPINRAIDLNEFYQSQEQDSQKKL